MPTPRCECSRLSRLLRLVCRLVAHIEPIACPSPASSESTEYVSLEHHKPRTGKLALLLLRSSETPLSLLLLCRCSLPPRHRA